MSEPVAALAETRPLEMSERALPGVPAFAWGYNARGGLGLGHTAQVLSPTHTYLPKGTVDVQGGVNFTVALTRKGEVFAWGGNQYGQLGDGTTSMRWKPTKVALPKGVRVAAIATGADHVVAATTSGGVLTWGRNHRGQIGNGSTTDLLTPVAVRNGLKGHVTAVAAGNGISAAVTRNGDLYLWGRNTFGQLGSGVTRDPGGSAVSQTRPAKAKLPKGADAIAVDAGNRHVAVALRDGRLVIFGLDAAGQPTEGTIRLKSAWGRPVKLAAGEDFTLILTSRRVLLALGANASGQLGVGDYNNRLQPAAVRIPHGSGHVLDFIAGARGGAALTSTGEVYSWGDGNVGQHGAGAGEKSLATRSTPARVTALAGARITGLHGGHHHAFVTVTAGPAVALRMLPVRKTIAPGVAVNYRVHKTDVFGNDLGPARQYTLTVTDGRVAGSTVIARTLGVHHVTARSGRLVGRALLTVTKGPRP